MRRTVPGSRILLLLGLAAVLAGCSGRAAPTRSEPSQGAGGEVTVTVFHETHTHGALLGEDQQSTSGPVPADGRTFAQYAGLLDQQRRRLQAGSSLFVGNGDDLSDELTIPAVFGGGAAIRTAGRHVVEAFNAAGMDADTFGCDYVMEGGPDLLRGLVARSRFRWVSANVRDGSRPSEVFAAEQGARRFTLAQAGGLRVGITGAASSECGQAAPVPAATLLDPVTALREVVPQLRAAGAQRLPGPAEGRRQDDPVGGRQRPGRGRPARPDHPAQRRADRAVRLPPTRHHARRAGVPSGQGRARRLPRHAAAVARCRRSTTTVQSVTRAAMASTATKPGKEGGHEPTA